MTRNLPPLLGGMEKLNHRLAAGLAEWAEVEVVGPVGCGASMRWARSREVPASPLWKFVPAAATAALASVVRRRPHLVLAGSGLSAPLAKLAAGVARARSAVYLHGLDLIVDQPVYRAVWLPAIRRTDIAIVNSRNTRRLAIQAGVAEQRAHVVNPGTELPAPQPAARERFRRRFGLGDAPVLLSVGRLTARKGLAAFVACALPALRARYPDLVLAVIGNDAPDALHRVGGGSAELLSIAECAGVASAVRLLGACDDTTLQEAYAGADLHVFPVREVAGDVEGFGMVAIEAAAQGLATVAFDVGGVADAVTADSGALVAATDYEGLTAEILRWLGEGYDRARCRAAAARFSWDRFDAEVKTLLVPLIAASVRGQQRR
ncbi:MAG TPA: glycosyltransferase family 4 protein [Xanthomonadaceae bacterium]|nr:glycosyltransferase family 4 protein [Xanthomonadaceae bacterium]